MNGVAIGNTGGHPPPPPTPASSSINGVAATSTDVLQQTRQDLQREVSHLSMLLGRAAAVLSGLDQALDPSHAAANGGYPPPPPGPHQGPAPGPPAAPHPIRESGSPVGHGYAPPPPHGGHPHGHGPANSHAPPPPSPSSQLAQGPPPQSMMPNDVKTSSALGLMALSSSAGSSHPGMLAGGRHDDRDMQQHHQQVPQPQHHGPSPTSVSRYPQAMSYSSYPLPRRSTEWKACITQGATALKSARTLQEIVARMNEARQKLISTIQRASPAGIMGVETILKTQEEERVAAAEAEVKRLEKEKRRARRLRRRANLPSSSDDDYSDDDDSEDDSDSEAEGQEGEDEEPAQKTVWGYVPAPTLIHEIIPGTMATPLAMSAYTQHVFDQIMDEMALKESILEALVTIGELKDSGADELPALLDQQLTNMVLIWELEPYIETVPERNEVEGSLSVLSWQMEKVK
ncbi:hypothetical protein EC957_004991 [Mortierella hygrophila]|uniref:Uncharacterized protein n=1 Tax=Mortierella hygrophila TaxID=979708 RepID=A0A9P6K6R1_9FUNG|nr:hypothetical protein EC957_004991 [Mortierella hygrophila]